MAKKTIAVIGATGQQGGGLARAILANPKQEFAARAVTRQPDSEKARALAAAGAEVVAGDLDDPASLERAFAGAHGVYAVTNYWEHFSVEREMKQAAAIARATKKAGVAHVVWSTLEDTREKLPLDDPRMPVLGGKYNVPHFDGKGASDAVFEREGAPTSYLLAAFYWDNFIYLGAGPKPNDQGVLTLTLPLGGIALAGIASADVGGCALGIFRRGPGAAGERFGISGENLTGEELAAGLSRALGRRIDFWDPPFDTYRGFGFPGADDLGNMFQYQAILGDEFLATRDPELARALHPGLKTYEAWLAENAAKIPLE